MRTTLDIDDSVLAAAKEIAAATNSSAGAVISELARKGLARAPVSAGRTKSGFPVFHVPEDAPPITSAAVKTILTDEGLPPRR